MCFWAFVASDSDIDTCPQEYYKKGICLADILIISVLRHSLGYFCSYETRRNTGAFSAV